MNYENQTCKKIAENLVMNGYNQRLDNFTLDAIYSALESQNVNFEDLAWFRKTIRRYMKQDAWFVGEVPHETLEQNP